MDGANTVTVASSFPASVYLAVSTNGIRDAHEKERESDEDMLKQIVRERERGREEKMINLREERKSEKMMMMMMTYRILFLALTQCLHNVQSSHLSFLSERCFHHRRLHLL